MPKRSVTHLTVDGRELAVTSLDKVMYPATGTTKGEVIEYYRAVAETFVAHNARRPATRKRWPDGVGTAERPGTSFFAKNLDSGTPGWVASVTLPHRHRAATYPLVDDAATLVWLAQIGALEIHVPQWRTGPRGGAQHPDRLVLDLDPGDGAGLEECVAVAVACKEILDGMSLASVPCTSGSKGIHLYAALDGTTTAAQATAVARGLAMALHEEYPELVVSEMKRAARAGKVFVDWSQNNGSKTTVAPYSLRGRSEPFVAAPRAWDELTTDPGALRQLRFDEILERLGRIGDLAAPLLGPAASATTAPRRTSIAPRQAATLPRVEPMLATAATVDQLRGRTWRFETKWDGYRAIAEVSGGRAVFRSRNGNDLTAGYPELAELGEALGDHDAVLDGEIVVLDGHGRSSFELLQNHGDRSSPPAHYQIFDVLHLDGNSLLAQPYLDRREILDGLGIDGEFVHVPPTLGDDAQAALAASREQRLEGVIAKTADGRYQPGRRAKTWLKIKNLLTQEVVVAGWLPGEGMRRGRVGSLLLAVTGDDGRLEYAGKVGTGFSDAALGEIGRRLAPLERPDPPLAGVPRAEAKRARWVEPTQVGEVAYGEWTSAGRLRHPTWRGWRDDKSAAEARRGDG